jgi:hypothetical protein
MKIAHTTTAARIALTASEYQLLGKPKRVWVDLSLRTVQPAFGSKGISVCDVGDTDLGHPYVVSVPKAFALAAKLPEFGAEVVNTDVMTKNNIPQLNFFMPAMTTPVRRREDQKNKVKTFSLADIIEKKPQTKVEPIPDAMRITKLVDEINSAKAALGKNFIICVDDCGFLEILTRAGR